MLAITLNLEEPCDRVWSTAVDVVAADSAWQAEPGQTVRAVPHSRLVARGYWAKGRPKLPEADAYYHTIPPRWARDRLEAVPHIDDHPGTAASGLGGLHFYKGAA